MCHCLSCQARTGSAFGIQARYPEDKAVVAGPFTTYARKGDSGGTITFRFCPTCGSTVCWTLDGLPGFLVVATGTFMDPAFPPPTVAVYTSRRHPWTAMPALSVEEHPLSISRDAQRARPRWWRAACGCPRR